MSVMDIHGTVDTTIPANVSNSYEYNCTTNCTLPPEKRHGGPRGTARSNDGWFCERYVEDCAPWRCRGTRLAVCVARTGSPFLWQMTCPGDALISERPATAALLWLRVLRVGRRRSPAEPLEGLREDKWLRRRRAVPLPFAGRRRGQAAGTEHLVVVCRHARAMRARPGVAAVHAQRRARLAVLHRHRQPERVAPWDIPFAASRKGPHERWQPKPR